jgi:hypothetical protein
MFPSSQDTQAVSSHSAGQLELARELYREYHGRCFWNSPRGLEIGESHNAFVEKGLRANGDHRAFTLSSKLRQDQL